MSLKKLIPEEEIEFLKEVHGDDNFLLFLRNNGYEI